MVLGGAAFILERGSSDLCKFWCPPKVVNFWWIDISGSLMARISTGNLTLYNWDQTTWSLFDICCHDIPILLFLEMHWLPPLALYTTNPCSCGQHFKQSSSSHIAKKIVSFTTFSSLLPNELVQFFRPFGIAIGVVVDKLRAAIDAAFQTNCYWWINYFTRMAALSAPQCWPASLPWLRWWWPKAP